VLGIGTLTLFTFHAGLGEAFPGQLAGLLMALAGMLLGSLAPQWITDRRSKRPLLTA